MAAALHAANEGASVALIEADDKLGGSTALSGGVYYAAGTSVQRERGIDDDTPDAMFEYYMTLNQYRVEASLARKLCDHAAEKLEWLKTLGVNFPAESLYSSGVESIPRGHAAHGRGAEIAEVLDREVSKNNIDVVLGSRLEELVIDPDGRVTGVRVGGDVITSHAVILATGGFGANPYYLNQYYPDAAEQHDKAWYIGSPHCQGDGLQLGQEAGADIVGYNRGILLTTPDFKKELEVFVPGWLTYVNREGRRFINEMAEYAVMSGVIKAQTGGSCFAIFDEEARRTAKPNKQYEDAFAAGIISLNWIADEIDAQIKTGKVIQADTLEGLETKCGIRPGSLTATYDKYNRDIKSGEDSMFFKDHNEMKPVETAPFYAVEILPAIICLTSTGLRINSQTQVLDERGQPIRGLYAAGETTGNVLGERYIGGGNSITNAIVFGAIAGVEATKEARRNS
ncbi:FAD-binding protein [Parasphingorhabdus sp. JC815]|uniref:FAD-dependent oxidoreductase n=1 Tax=Parasphingorhabdus sp. JC815 TaxID=3232140 RepID=UPI00345A2D4E